MSDPVPGTQSRSTRWLRVETITDVAESQLCCGCGACASAQPDVITMVDDLDAGRRPMVTTGSDTAEALSVCPGIALERSERPGGTREELWEDWGPVLGLWEGHSADPVIRFSGSSGGAASALALHAIEALGFAGVLHTAARPDNPILNETVMSTTRDQIISRTGSRYSPASPADSLALIEESTAPSVFIGKPCDVAGALSLSRKRQELGQRLGLTIAVFCAGTPSVRGTLEMLEAMGIRPGQLDSLRYRGNGWPGHATATFTDSSGAVVHRSLTYGESWGEILQKHRQWRCHLCFDHTGEFADISVGDPWHREIGPDEIGSSLVVARTERGCAIVKSAIAAGDLALEPVGSECLTSSQPNLLVTRGSVWGRTRTLSALGLPAPQYRGVNLRRAWFRRLDLRARARSIVGTIRRAKRRGLSTRRPVIPYSTERPDSTDTGAQA